MRIPVILMSWLLTSCANDSVPAARYDTSRALSSSRQARAIVLPNVAPHDLPVQLVAQHTPKWCWAATGEMVMATVPGGRRVPQCKQAADDTPGSDCCQDPPPSRCIHGGWPRFERYGFRSAPRRKGVLTWEEIKHQIDGKRAPVAFTWRIVGKGTHMMALGGYAEADDSRWVTVYEPLDVDQGDVVIMTYAAYVSGPDYRPWFNYFDIEVAP